MLTHYIRINRSSSSRISLWWIQGRRKRTKPSYLNRKNWDWT